MNYRFQMFAVKETDVTYTFDVTDEELASFFADNPEYSIDDFLPPHDLSKGDWYVLWEWMEDKFGYAEDEIGDTSERIIDFYGEGK